MHHTSTKLNSTMHAKLYDSQHHRGGVLQETQGKYSSIVSCVYNTWRILTITTEQTCTPSGCSILRTSVATIPFTRESIQLQGATASTRWEAIRKKITYHTFARSADTRSRSLVSFLSRFSASFALTSVADSASSVFLAFSSARDRSATASAGVAHDDSPARAG